MSTNLAISGLASNFDWQSLITQLAEVERAPEKQLLAQQSLLELQNNALTSVKTELGVLQGKAAALKDGTLFESRTTNSSDLTLATASATNGTALGTTTFNIIRLATAAILKGTSGIGAPLNGSDDVSALQLSSAGFATAVTGGTFTVNGKQISIATDDTLGAVFDKISSATQGAVTASYSAATDQISLTSASEIVLGSATDTSNFLQVSKLRNSGTGTITSWAKLGAVKATSVLNAANFATTVQDGGDGEFKINGVSIEFSASSDTLNDVIRRINDSGAGVLASYDSVSNRLTLSNKLTGDIGIAVEDVTGNFIAATQLATGTLDHGKDLLYSINGGPELSSQSNTITQDSSGISGLSVKALKEGTVQITVGSDTARIKTAITDFVAAYNKVQALIGTQLASSTDAKGKVTAGILANDSDVNNLASQLRRMMTATFPTLSGTVQRLESLGFISNGNDDSLTTANLAGLDAALTSNLPALKELFTKDETGLAIQIDSFVDKLIGSNGSLIAHQSNLTQQSKGIDVQIDNIEKQVLAYQERLTSEFVAMEMAQSQINQQMQYLLKTFGT